MRNPYGMDPAEGPLHSLFLEVQLNHVILRYEEQSERPDSTLTPEGLALYSWGNLPNFSRSYRTRTISTEIFLLIQCNLETKHYRTCRYEDERFGL